MRCTFKYYARNEKEKKFDDWIRDAVRTEGSKADMALYIQNQALLNMIRRMEDSAAR
ncbi:MAG: hypothetical protein HFH39_04070 [Lachnospiraceae bacterium]|jgi:hypothetical protein|nr:hypothetical protein [Lachnospiraceae bacterium]